MNTTISHVVSDPSQVASAQREVAYWMACDESGFQHPICVLGGLDQSAIRKSCPDLNRSVLIGPLAMSPDGKSVADRGAAGLLRVHFPKCGPLSLRARARKQARQTRAIAIRSTDIEPGGSKP